MGIVEDEIERTVDEWFENAEDPGRVMDAFAAALEMHVGRHGVRCATCSVPEHPQCPTPLDATCPCCRDTMENIALFQSTDVSSAKPSTVTMTTPEGDVEVTRTPLRDVFCTKCNESVGEEGVEDHRCTFKIPVGEDGFPDTDQSPNGWCDVCKAPISDNPAGGVRFCPNDITHDCYSDGFNNGGDPYESMEGSVYPTSREGSRGFSRGEYVQTYKGCGRWRLRESSNAAVPCLWFDVAEPPDLNAAVIAHVTGNEVSYNDDTTIQLAASDARDLRDALDYMLKTHYHGDVSRSNPELEDEETIN